MCVCVREREQRLTRRTSMRTGESEPQLGAFAQAKLRVGLCCCTTLNPSTLARPLAGQLRLPCFLLCEPSNRRRLPPMQQTLLHTAPPHWLCAVHTALLHCALPKFSLGESPKRANFCLPLRLNRILLSILRLIKRKSSPIKLAKPKELFYNSKTKFRPQYKQINEKQLEVRSQVSSLREKLCEF